jgi:hypothetical protein
MSAINILFFSNNCPGSQTLITLLKNEGLLRFFHLMCTDNNPSIPPMITVTPTLVIRNVSTPYVAGDAFQWMNKMKQWKINEQMKKMSNMQQEYLQKMAGNLGMNNTLTGVAGFSSEEMAGMSDMFAFWNEDNPLQHSYFDCTNLGKEMIYAPPLEEEAAKKNLLTEQQREQNARVSNDRAKKLKQERIEQDNVFKHNIEEFRNQFRG